MHRKFKTTLMLLGLLVWQIGNAASYAAAAAHLPQNLAAQVEAAASEAAPHCHGEPAAQPASALTPPVAPPCCQDGDCQGDCLLAPAVPQPLHVVAIVRCSLLLSAPLPAAHWTKREPALFRPPI
jgi:hypothetical protein